jgi:hypothetical protein
MTVKERKMRRRLGKRSRRWLRIQMERPGVCWNRAEIRIAGATLGKPWQFRVLRLQNLGDITETWATA